MAQPATGVDWVASGLAYLDTLRIRRGGQWQLAVRDYGGEATNISPGSAFGAPMALDGNWRADLFAVKKVGGKWVYNEDANEGCYPIGSLAPDGVERAAKTDSDPLEILQSIDPARIDMIKRDKQLMFTPLESTPWVHLLRYNRPLVNVLESAAPNPAATYFASESAGTEYVQRQVIVMHQDGGGGQLELNAFPFSLCYLTDSGSQKGNKRDVDAGKLTLTRVLDPWFTDLTGQGIIDGHWQSGSLWANAFTTGFTFRSDAPLVTPATATTATLTVKTPIGGTGSLTYTVAKSASAAMTSPSAVTTGTVTVSGEVTTIPLTALTTGTTSYYRVTAEDSATPTANTAVSKVSNAATQP